MARKIKRRPFHPFEESILRTLNKSRKQLTPTRIADIVRIHPVTAQSRIQSLRARGFVIVDKRGKRRLVRINRRKF